MFVFIGIVYMVILGLTIISLSTNWRKSIRNDFRKKDELNWGIILSGMLFTTLSPIIGFMRFDAYGPEIPFAKEHVQIIELLIVVSAACYWLSKFFKNSLSPIVNILLCVGLIQGIILDFIVTIHFTNYLGMGIIFPLFGFELLAPPIAMFFLLYELQCNLKNQRQNPPSAFSVRENIPMMVGLVFALIVVEQIVLLPMGSQWNSLALAFTESRGFIFSGDFEILSLYSNE